MTYMPECLVDDSFDPVAYINEPRWRSSRMGLDRIVELMERLGDPQKSLRFIHVAGTNGKGSTCAFLSSILQQAGYKIGLFTSPYIIEFSDRIRVNGENISSDDLLHATLVVREQAELMDDHPTEFELMTAVALVHFQRSECDIVVMEVGLGGSYDSTNVIPAPEVCVIAPIALDHVELLGDTVSKIASEKAGIIKHGSAVVSAVQDGEALSVISAKCKGEGCALTCVEKCALQGKPWSFSYKGREDLEIGLVGSYQTQNAALAIEAIDSLRQRGFKFSEESIRNGLKLASWPARFQVIEGSPTVVIDGGHNAQGAQALADSLQLNYPGQKAVFLMGVLADKDYVSMIRILAPFASSFVCVTPPNPRALPAAELALAIHEECTLRLSLEVAAVGSFEAGVAMAKRIAGPDGLVCACGSLYSVADLMRCL